MTFIYFGKIDTLDIAEGALSTIHYPAFSNEFNPADATTYYVGGADVETTASQETTLPVLINGNPLAKLMFGYIVPHVTTPGTTGNVIFSFDIYDDDMNLLTTTGTITGNFNSVNATSFNITFTGQNRLATPWRVALKIETPTWVTNPTGVRINWGIFVAP